jgi:hypothetical protein
MFGFMKARISLLIGLVASVMPSIAAACSVCFAGDDDAVTHAFNWSVFFLLSAPYTIAGSIAACLVVAYRRAVAKREAEEQEKALGQLVLNQEESGR